MDDFTFEIDKYLGTWYELINYPEWFQPNYSYNTKAIYKLNDDGTLTIHNSTISEGEQRESIGQARILDGPGINLMVDFPELSDDPTPNYIIDRLWIDERGNYLFSVVTNANRNSLYVLSRYRRPSLSAYIELMEYVLTNYDRTKIIQTPHY
jgi:lipocalin